MQGSTTPEIHLKMADWLERCWRDKKERLLLMAFRSAGKSTIVGLFAAWLIYKTPDIRILVLAADQILSEKMVRNVKRIIERHPLTKGLKPANADQWAADRFTVKRNAELRDPTMIGKGVMSNITGSRADIAICDDVEVPNTCDTSGKRQDLRDRLSEVSYVLISGGTKLYVGTPHNYESIYNDVAHKEDENGEPFLKNFERLKLPIFDENGQSAWPERYSKERIEQYVQEAGLNKFESQMMLKPVNILDSRLNPGVLRTVLKKNNTPTRVIKATSKKNKALRIIESFESIMASKRLRVHKNVKNNTSFLQEMREWRPGTSRVHDDALDAVASAIAREPDRMERAYTEGSFNWTRTSNPHTVKKNWDV